MSWGPRYDTEEAPRTATVHERIAYACQQIEGAQRLLAAACANLSPVVGGIAAFTCVNKLHDRVHNAWYKVRALYGSKRVALDGR